MEPEIKPEQTGEITSVPDDLEALRGPYTDGSDEGDLKLSMSKETVVIEKNDRSLSEFHRWYQAGRLIIDPEWQRSYVWDRRRASRLIESFLLDIPVPVIYLAKNTEGKYEVIDGVQRLTSLFQYFEGKFSFTGLEMLPQFNKKSFSELPLEEQNKLQDTTLRTFELSPLTSSNLLFVIFERLNTGGIPLNEMEVRNCVYRGTLNNLIRELAKYPECVDCLNQKDVAKRMGDRNMVLRFLAFYERTFQKASQGLKQFINEFFETYRNPPEAKLKEFEKQFKKAMRASLTVFGNQGFRIRRHDEKGGGEWATRVNASVFQVIAVSFTNYDLGQITERADAIYEEYLDLIATDTQWINAVTKSTGDPNNIRYAFQTWNDRLALLMSGTRAKDTNRIFSKSLKNELFMQDRKCSICAQEIKLINDAALDHEIHYWRGGKTVPTNARLVHRICNLKRTL
jgi:5-methylcytosine-specific restriction endonuclease McrA